MDGRRSVKELVIAYYQRHGVLARARVAGLVHLLRRERFLTGSPDVYATLRAALEPNTTRRPPGGFTTLSADRRFAKTYRLWGHTFSRSGWLYGGIGLGLLSPVLVLLALPQRRYHLYDVGGWGALPILVLLGLKLVALGVHELGHGMPVKHAGREVHEAGVRLYFGLP